MNYQDGRGDQNHNISQQMAAKYKGEEKSSSFCDDGNSC